MEIKKDSLPHFRPDLPRRLIRWNMRRFQERRKHHGLKSSPGLRSGLVPWNTTQPPVTSASFPLKGAGLEASSKGFKITSNTAATDMNSNAHSRAHSRLSSGTKCCRHLPAQGVFSPCQCSSSVKAADFVDWRLCGWPLQDTMLTFIQLAFTAHRSTHHTCIW